MKKLFVFVTILFIYIALPSRSFAQTVPQQFVTVDPIIKEVTLTPGESLTYHLQLTNKGDKPVGFHIDLSDADPTAEGSPISMSHTSAFLSWITTYPTDLIVAPHESNAFVVTIKTPKEAKNSGYFATLFLTPFISNPLKTSGPVVLERIGSLLFATVGQLNYEDLSKKVQISSFTFDHKLFQTPHALSFTVTNTYFTHFSAKPFLTLSSLRGNTQTVYPTEKHVLPGKTRTWEYPITLPWYTLYSSAHLAVSVGGGYQVIADTSYINYSLILETVVIICLFLFMLRRRKKLKKAIKILFLGHP